VDEEKAATSMRRVQDALAELGVDDRPARSALLLVLSLLLHEERHGRLDVDTLLRDMRAIGGPE
jgi:hypothetical protein